MQAVTIMPARAKAKQQKKSSKGGQGGPAGGGGMNFQADALAIAAVHMLRGTSTGWLENTGTAVPIAISAETKGPGDDIKIELDDGKTIEAQVKRGAVRQGQDLWDVLIGLARGINDAECNYGVLIVSPKASAAIRHELALDLRRLAEGRTDELKDISKEFRKRLKAEGLPEQETCARLFIQTVHAITGDRHTVASATGDLKQLLELGQNPESAYNLLFRTFSTMIANRGRIDLATLTNRVRQKFELATGASAAGAISALVDWSNANNSTFEITGCATPVRISDGWIPLKASVRTGATSGMMSGSEALELYHKPSSGSGEGGIDAGWIGEFYRHAVVVAGAGLGKTTLLKRIAWRQSLAGRPALTVKLKQVALQMEKEGAPFADAVLEQALSGAPISVREAKALGLGNLVYCCDGIDECGDAQGAVLEGLAALVTGHPQARIIVTTRPVGYSSAKLSDWRHYDLLPLAHPEGESGLATLLDQILPANDKRRGEKLILYAQRELAASAEGDAIAKRPQLIGLAASLLTKREHLGATRVELYRDMFELFETTNPRYVGTKPPASQLRWVLNALGWEILRDPVRRASDILDDVARGLAAELGKPGLAAHEIAERCCDYWEQGGLVERLHASGMPMLTFTHQTFAEFAAARHIAALESAARQGAFAHAVAHAGWGEVLSFGASLGFAEEIIGLQLETDGGTNPDGLVASMRIVEHADVVVGSALAERLIATAAATMADADKEMAFKLGSALADIARVAPEAVEKSARTLLQSGRDWLRIAGWACLAELGGDFPLEQFIAEAIVVAHNRSLKPRRLIGLNLSDYASKDLLDRAVLAAVRHGLRQMSADELGEKFAALWKLDEFNTIGFVRDVQAISTDPGLMKHFASYDSIRNMSLGWSNSDRWGKANRVSGVAIAQAIIEATAGLGDPGIPAVAGFGQFNAVLTATDRGSSIAGDVYAFMADFDRAAFAETIKGLIGTIPVDPAALRAEATAALPKIERDDQGWSRWTLDLPEVDLPKPDWSRAAGLQLDDGKLIDALGHGSVWVVPIAAQLLEARKTVPVERLKKLLGEATGYKLWAAAYLTNHLAGAEAAPMLSECIETRRVKGTEYVVSELSELETPWSEDLSRAMTTLLMGTEARPAEAAAKLVKERVKAGDAVSPQLLQEAFDHWLTTETPYPKGGGVVPVSPRAALLGALVATEAIEMKTIISHLGDDRTDVREVATAAIKQALARKEDVDVIVGAILAKTLKPQQVRDLIREAPILRQQGRRLEALSQDDNPAYRLASIGLFAASDEDGQGALERLSYDPHEEVAEAARAALGSIRRSSKAGSN